LGKHKDALRGTGPLTRSLAAARSALHGVLSVLTNFYDRKGDSTDSLTATWHF